MYLFHAEIPISFLYARFFKTNMIDGKRKVVEYTMWVWILLCIVDY